MKVPIDSEETMDEAAENAAETVEGTAAEAAAEPVIEDAEVLDPEEERARVEEAIRRGEEAAEKELAADAGKLREERDDLAKQLAGVQDQIDAAQVKANEANERYMRLQADWDNFRRRTAAERLAEKERAAEKLVVSLLPVLDDMERAIEHAGDTENNEQLKQFVGGIGAVHQKMLGALQKEGVEVIDPAGEPFEPLAHQAVGRVEDAEAYDETVAQVYQKGYKMGDKVIRNAMVTVTFGGPKRPAPEPADADAAPEGDGNN
ncbi:nucleotide exchange factor GrpE [Paratractidigestivibacter sp.]|uniref:nucleotide exchange factor GrpE n=1 Tax=Paratractidigestivibacter sp. TaxID=2847316 RepID=UPI002AC9B9C2|nr:nucleotide exchange factor GrpE [Paratractidigestivibacter sp.]